MIRSKRLFPFLVLLTAFSIWILLDPPTGKYRTESDDDGYLEIGKQLAQGNGYCYLPQKPTAFRVPGLPILCALSLKIFSNRGPLVIEVLQRIFILFALLVLFLVIRKTISTSWAWASLFCALADPYFYEHGTRFTQTSGAFLLTTLLMFFFTKIPRSHKFHKNSPKNTQPKTFWLALGVFLGLATLYRQSFFPLTLALLLWGLLRDKKMSLILLAGFSLMMSPWWIRNITQFDRLIITDTLTPATLMCCYHPKVFNDLEVTIIGYHKDSEFDRANLLENKFTGEDALGYVTKQLKEAGLFKALSVFLIKAAKFFYPYCHVERRSFTFIPLFLFKFLILLGFFHFLFFYLPKNFSQLTSLDQLCLILMAFAFIQALVFHPGVRLQYPFWPAKIYLALKGISEFLPSRKKAQFL